MILEQHRDQARRAFYATSFDPEKRGDQLIDSYSAELESDLKELPESSRDNYQSKYIGYFLSWVRAKSRCMSSMITGPANFPVARNEKFNRWEQSAYEIFRSFRERFIKAVNRVPTPSPEEDLDNALKELDKAKYRQEWMKACNKVARMKIPDHEKIRKLIDDEWTVEDGVSLSILQGFQSFELTNNNAKIKRLEEKVLTMKARIARKETFEPISFPGGKISIEADRVIITHDERPSQEVIDRLKSRGFHWSRNYGSWSRKHTANAIYAAKYVVGIAE